MIQVEETKGLGDGQKIETEMAEQVGLKVFRTYTNVDDFATPASWTNPDYRFNGIDAISKAVKDWYETGCNNNDLENVFIGCQYAAHNEKNKYSYSVRPPYEKM